MWPASFLPNIMSDGLISYDLTEINDLSETVKHHNELAKTILSSRWLFCGTLHPDETCPQSFVGPTLGKHLIIRQPHNFQVTE